MKRAVKILKKIILSILALVLLLMLILAISIPYGKSKTSSPITSPGAEQSKMVLQNVHIVAMDTSEVIYNKNVYINLGKIVNITPDSLPLIKGYTPINTHGKYLVPGLIDMHAHIFDRTDLTQYLSYGVTTVRNMMGFPMHLRWKQQWEANEIAGSRLITATPTLNSGEDTGPFHKNIDTASEAEKAVEDYANAGYDFVKIYNGIDSLQLKAIESAAQKNNMDIAGHPPSISLDGILSSEIVSIEHIEELYYLLGEDYSASKMRGIAKKLKISGKAVVINLAAFHRIYKTVVEGQTYYDGLESEHLNPIISFIGKKQLKDYLEAGPKYVDYCKTKYKAMQDFTQILAQEEVKILFGTDTGPNLIIPGATVLEEIILLKDAGLSSFQILQSATYNAANVLNRSDLGIIAVGSQAELIILEDNPLENLQTLKQPKWLLAHGQIYNEDAIKKLREKGQNKQNTYATIGLWLEHLFKK